MHEELSVWTTPTIVTVRSRICLAIPLGLGLNRGMIERVILSLRNIDRRFNTRYPYINPHTALAVTQTQALLLKDTTLKVKVLGAMIGVGVVSLGLAGICLRCGQGGDEIEWSRKNW
jgi:hypothetical protein